MPIKFIFLTQSPEIQSYLLFPEASKELSFPFQCGTLYTTENAHQVMIMIACSVANAEPAQAAWSAMTMGRISFTCTLKNILIKNEQATTLLAYIHWQQSVVQGSGQSNPHWSLQSKHRHTDTQPTRTHYTTYLGTVNDNDRMALRLLRCVSRFSKTACSYHSVTESHWLCEQASSLVCATSRYFVETTPLCSPPSLPLLPPTPLCCPPSLPLLLPPPVLPSFPAPATSSQFYRIFGYSEYGT